MENDAKLKELQEEYGIDPDDEESKELSKLAFKMNNSKDGLSDEEISKMSEYQQKALYYVAANQQNSLDIDRAKAQQMGNVQGYADMKRERAEADSMGAEDAQRTIISEGASMEDTQNAVNSEITNILNKLSLLSNDVKGSTIDSQI